MFRNILKKSFEKFKEEGKCRVKHKDTLTGDVLRKLLESFDISTHIDLQNKVFGRENLRNKKV